MNDDFVQILVIDLKLPADRLVPTATLEEAGFDSLSFVELATVLSDRFEIKVPDTELRAALTLAELDELVQRRRGRRG